MLASLLGSKSAERILLFLWVNEGAYISQIQKSYGVALTPLQNMMRKFERGGVVTSTPLGKKKIYCLNSQYPFYVELKSLLQKGFSQLPAEEKKCLFIFQESKTLRPYRYQKRVALCLQAFWERILCMQRVTIRAQTGEEAVGEVKIKEEKPGVLVFIERGWWIKKGGGQIGFKNSLRWSFLFEDGLISLEHLRHGPNYPIFLCHLAPQGPRLFQSIDSHLCGSDCYFGKVEFNKQAIHLTWRILSAHKNETLYCTYT